MFGPMEDTDLTFGETGFDQLLAFTIPDRNCRGRLVRLGPVLDTILSAHDYSPPVKLLLAEALVLTALMGGLLKGEDNQLTLQAQTREGVVELLVCDYRNGELRGYVQHAAEQVASIGANPGLEALFAGGHLAITFDIARTGKRYQGVVPLEGDSLSQAVEAYFARSEQVPTIIRTAVRAGRAGGIGGGMLIQHLPAGEDGRERLHAGLDDAEWEHVSVLAQSIRHEELVDPAISLEAVIWRLYHEEREVRIEPGAQIARGCRCSERHFEEVLARFPAEDRKEMRDEKDVILVDCAFCSKQFPIQD